VSEPQAAVDIASIAPDEGDPRGTQSLSMLIGLLFDLQMRSALADPLTPSETRSERLERSA